MTELVSIDAATIKPTITLAVMAFNHEKFIESAIKSALAQDYDALEIVISDDRSTDATFEIASSICEVYRGPHSLILRRQPSNQGIGEHINAIMAASSGQLVVIAAGDDLSYPQRVRAIVEAWEHLGKPAASLHSNFDSIKLDGSPSSAPPADGTKSGACTPEETLTRNPVVGATHAWSRLIFDTFGPLMPSIVHEDRTIAFRASLMGGVHHVAESLVARREGGISDHSSTSGRLARRRINARRYASDCIQALSDLELAERNGLINADRKLRLSSIASARLAMEEVLRVSDSPLRTLSTACSRAAAMLVKISAATLRALLRA